MSVRDGQRIRVLLVDDHHCVLWGLAKLIESAGPRFELVGVATCQSEALLAAQKHQPHVVLLDLDLDGQSGFDLIPRLSSQAAVLVLTGLRDPQAVQRAVVDGARGIIHKTESAELILKAIERVHAGEPWLERAAMGKVLQILSRRGASQDEQRNHETLTAAERKVVAAVARQASAPNKVVATTLNISEHTLRNHLTAIYAKLGVGRRVDLVLYAMEHGFVQPSEGVARGATCAHRSPRTSVLKA